MNLSLRWKIAINMGAMAAACTILASMLSTFILIRSSEDAAEQQLKATVTTLMSLGISDYSGLAGFQKLDAFIDQALNVGRVDQIIQVYTKRGKLMFSSIPKSEDNYRKIFHPVERPTFIEFESKKSNYKILIMPYRARSGKEYFLQMAMPYSSYWQALASTLGSNITLFIILSLLAFFISHLLAKKLIAPVREIALYLNEFNPADRERLPLILAKPGEYLIDIAHGINSLALRVQGSLYMMSRASRYLAHELRNPLTILTGEAEAILLDKEAAPEQYRQVIQSSLEEIQRIDGVVTTVLSIYKREKNSFKPAPCDLSSWILEHLPEWSRYLGCPIEFKPSEAFIAVVDRPMLFRLVDNLIRNIKKHAITSQVCRMGLERRDSKTILTIEDKGVGMPPSLLEALNQGDMSHRVIGIGLNLCLEIASICRFKLEFANLAGGGLKVEIEIE